MDLQSTFPQDLGVDIDGASSPEMLHERQQDFNFDSVSDTNLDESVEIDSSYSKRSSPNNSSSRSRVYELELMLSALRKDNDILKVALDSKDNQISYFIEYINAHCDSKNSTTKRVARNVNAHVLKTLLSTLNAVIFPYVKFVDKDELHSFDEESIGHRIMSAMGIQTSQYYKWWAVHSKDVWKYFTTNRSKFSDRVKHSFEKGKISVLNHF